MNPDKAQVPVNYVRDHYNQSDRLAVVLIHRDTGSIKHEFRTAEQLTDAQYQAHLRASNAHGADVYLSVNTLRPEATGRTKNDIDEVRHIYLDVDRGGREAVDKILRAEDMPKPHSILETSPGKHQILWQVEGFEKDQAETLVKELVGKFDGDPAAVDCARVLRIPGFRNCKYDQPHYVKVQDGGADRVYQPGDFPRYEVERESAPKFGERPPGERSVPGNSQSEADWAFALRGLERGDEPDVIAQKIAEYRRHDKPSPEKYAQRTVMNARMKLLSRPMGSTSQPRTYMSPSR